MNSRMVARSKVKDIELHPDAWPRFERFIRDIAKAGPQHRKGKPRGKSGKNPAKWKVVRKGAPAA